MPEYLITTRKNQNLTKKVLEAVRLKSETDLLKSEAYGKNPA